MASLTVKQEQFCNEYLVDLNATQAAIRAGYSAKTAAQQGFQLLKKTSVAKAIQKKIQERSRRTEINADWVLSQAAEVFKVAMGQSETKIVVRESIGDGMTEHRTQEMEKHDLASANKALEIIGKHIDIKAFDNSVTNLNVDMTEEQALKVLAEHGIDPKTLA
jgi:phage terminase small subunit